MDREKASVIIGCLVRNSEFMNEESGSAILKIVDNEQRRILKELVDKVQEGTDELHE